MNKIDTRLVRGNVSLATTYWIYTVIVPNAGLYLLEWLLTFVNNIIISTSIIIMGNGAYVAYYVYIFISLRATAKKYTGREIWPLLAMLSILLWALLIIVGIILSHSV